MSEFLKRLVAHGVQVVGDVAVSAASGLPNSTANIYEQFRTRGSSSILLRKPMVRDAFEW